MPQSSRLRGESVGQILQAGEWRSAAFLRYVDEEQLDRQFLLTRVLGESGSDEDGP